MDCGEDDGELPRMACNAAGTPSSAAASSPSPPPGTAWPSIAAGASIAAGGAAVVAAAAAECPDRCRRWIAGPYMKFRACDLLFSLHLSLWNSWFCVFCEI